MGRLARVECFDGVMVCLKERSFLDPYTLNTPSLLNSRGGVGCLSEVAVGFSGFVVAIGVGEGAGGLLMEGICAESTVDVEEEPLCAKELIHILKTKVHKSSKNTNRKELNRIG